MSLTLHALQTVFSADRLLRTSVNVSDIANSADGLYYGQTAQNVSVCVSDFAYSVSSLSPKNLVTFSASLSSVKCVQQPRPNTSSRAWCVDLETDICYKRTKKADFAGVILGTGLHVQGFPVSLHLFCPCTNMRDYLKQLQDRHGQNSLLQLLHFFSC